MTHRTRLTAVAVAALMLWPAATRSTETGPEESILALRATQEPGRTTLYIDTSATSVNYTSYSRDLRTLIVDLYGLEGSSFPTLTQVGTSEVESVEFEFRPARPGYSSIARFIVHKAMPGRSRIEVEGTSVVLGLERGGEAPASSRATAGSPASAQAPASASHAAFNTGTASLAAGHGATRVHSLSATGDGESLTIDIRGDGQIDYDVFPLENPPRLVLDLKGVQNQVARGQYPIESGSVERIRVAQFQLAPRPITRVVFDLASMEQYKIVSTPTGALYVRFGDLEWEPPGMPEAELQTEGSLRAAGAAAPGYPSREMQEGRIFEATPTELVEGEFVGSPQVFGVIEEEEGMLISLDLKEADIQDVLRYFSEISGLNIILDSAVRGKVTVRLIDVPWNKALDIILKTYGYDKILEGNVLRIASVDKLRQEEKAAAELKREQFLNRPLITITWPVSYAKAQDVAKVLQETVLTERGSVIIDDRTQTLVIQEVSIPEIRQRIIDLIQTLDKPTPQVEIEARIVETNKNFQQAFGIQWGFQGFGNQVTGTTTDFEFPNNFIIDGGAVAPNQGGFASRLGADGGWAVNVPTQEAPNSAIGFSFGNILNTFQLDVALMALEGEGLARVISSPKVTTLNNKAANIESGTRIPVQVIANNTITQQFVSASLRLIVTPQITADKTVIMQLTVEESAPDFANANVFGVPPISTRQATTEVLVPDGGTAVIGGVFQFEDTTASSRVPVAHKLPFIGWLFKNKNERRENDELLIFVTPKIRQLSKQ